MIRCLGNAVIGQRFRSFTPGLHLHSDVMSPSLQRVGPLQLAQALEKNMSDLCSSCLLTPDSCSAHGWLMRLLKIVQPWTLSLLGRGQVTVDELGEPWVPALQA